MKALINRVNKLEKGINGQDSLLAWLIDQQAETWQGLDKEQRGAGLAVLAEGVAQEAAILNRAGNALDTANPALWGEVIRAESTDQESAALGEAFETVKRLQRLSLTGDKGGPHVTIITNCEPV